MVCLKPLVDQRAPTINKGQDRRCSDTYYHVPFPGQSDLVTHIFIQQHRH